MLQSLLLAAPIPDEASASTRAGIAWRSFLYPAAPSPVIGKRDRLVGD